ncbi:MAG: CHAT domain-containing tetratricopeptide repeat protein [Pyrinomonadaceae bacterium]
MNPTDLAKLLLESPPDRQAVLIDEHGAASAVEVAGALQTICYEVWTDDPQRIAAIAETLELLTEHTQNTTVRAYSEWTNAINALVNGDLESCLRLIGESESTFLNAGESHLAAKTQTSKLYALALLGRYDEAVECGKKALEIFLAHGDLYSAGKIEHNIGNLYWRRDMYRESEPFLASAHKRFTEIGDQRHLAMIENTQAFVKTLQNDFRGAEPIYFRSLERAISNTLTVTAAEVETGLSILYLFKGDYALALKYMERSRQKYEELEMPAQSANCELEIAEIYLELNLLPEALSFYEKGALHFAALGGQAELARCNLGQARTLQRLGRGADAVDRLDLAEELFEKEGNPVAVGAVRLARSQELLNSGDLDEAENQAALALSAFRNGANVRLELFAQWLSCEILHAYGRGQEATEALYDILDRSKETSSEIQYLCSLLLGKITGDPVHFKNAVDLVERSRLGLTSPELRTSYFAEKLTPYDELIKLSLENQHYEEAFSWHERSRSRSMVEGITAPDSGSHSNEKLRSIREELNWLHRRINSVGSATDAERAKATELRAAAEVLEKEYAEILRRLHSDGQQPMSGEFGLDVEEFREQLGEATVLEFVSIDGKLSVFAISKTAFAAIPNYIDESELNDQINQYLFQLKTGRFIDRLSKANAAAARERLQIHSRALYDLILRPIESHLARNRLVIVPAGRMHYLPFQALHDGERFLCERFPISYAPSSAVLGNSLARHAADIREALIAGVADAAMPEAEAEVEGVSRFFSTPARLFGSEVTVANIRSSVAGKGVLHLACHGHFRPDNPGFSSLDLFGEKMTANEVQNLPLERCIIVLSSCEGGLNEVVRGEELIGLTSAFFAAGASTLIHSLWRVNDEAALELMLRFYDALTRGMSPADALRKAQLQLIGKGKHPYLWAPFIVSGRW